MCPDVLVTWRRSAEIGFGVKGFQRWLSRDSRCDSDLSAWRPTTGWPERKLIMPSFLKLFCLSILPLPLVAVSGSEARQPLKSQTVEIKGAPERPAKRLLFLDFYNEADEKNYQFLAASISDAAHNSIRSRFRYVKIDSQLWRDYAQQNAWQAADFYDPVKIRRMALDLGADGAIYGRFVASEQVLQIDGAILSAVDGEILGRSQASARPDSTMFQSINVLAESLAIKIQNLFLPSDTGALYRASLLPGWGHFYKERREWGYFWSISTGTAAAFTLTATTVFLVYRQKYTNASPELYRNSAGQVGFFDETAAQADFDRLERTANNWGHLALGGLITTLTLYGANLLHAYFISANLGNLAATQDHAGFKIDLQPVVLGEMGSSGKIVYEIHF